jgi:hypothetical protein
MPKKTKKEFFIANIGKEKELSSFEIINERKSHNIIDPDILNDYLDNVDSDDDLFCEEDSLYDHISSIWGTKKVTKKLNYLIITEEETNDDYHSEENENSLLSDLDDDYDDDILDQEEEFLRQESLFDFNSTKQNSKNISDLSTSGKNTGNPLIDINNRILNFMKDSKRLELKFSAASKSTRQNIHLISSFYHLISKSKGKEPRRKTTVRKCRDSRIPEPKVLENLEKMCNKGKLFHYREKKKHSSSHRRSNNNNFSPSVPRPRHGDIVGENAPVIGDSSVGHKMLRKLGWKPGDSLGIPSEGKEQLSEPLEAVYRLGGVGLGFSRKISKN